MSSAPRRGGGACWTVELVDLADLPVEHTRGRVAAQLADAPREWPGRVAELRARAGRRRGDGVGHYRWFVAAPDRFGKQGVEHFAASRINAKGLIGGGRGCVERGPGVGGVDQQHPEPPPPPPPLPRPGGTPPFVLGCPRQRPARG